MNCEHAGSKGNSCLQAPLGGRGLVLDCVGATQEKWHWHLAGKRGTWLSILRGTEPTSKKRLQGPQMPMSTLVEKHSSKEVLVKHCYTHSPVGNTRNPDPGTSHTLHTPHTSREASLSILRGTLMLYFFGLIFDLQMGSRIHLILYRDLFIWKTEEVRENSCIHRFTSQQPGLPRPMTVAWNSSWVSCCTCGRDIGMWAIFCCFTRHQSKDRNGEARCTHIEC